MTPVFSPVVELARLTSAEVSLRRFLSTVGSFAVTPDERGVIAQRCRALAAEVADLALYVGNHRPGFPGEIMELVDSMLDADGPFDRGVPINSVGYVARTYSTSSNGTAPIGQA